MSCNNDDIIKGSDKVIDIQIALNQGVFQFSDYDRVRLIIKDKTGVEIQRCAYPTESGYTTLRPVARTESVTGNYEYATDTSSDIGQIYLLGANTTGKATGNMIFEYYYRIENTYFTDDTYNDDIDRINAFNLID